MVAQADHVHDLRRAWFLAWHRKLFGTGGPKVIHVAGTNGKGTTCNVLRNALVGLGHRVGLFTSPHIHSACERIQVGAQCVPWQVLASLVEQNVSHMQPWMVPFDRYLVIALAHFAHVHCDFIVLETGIGGLFDSTNYVERPVACVITSISFDHCGLLGHTIAEIARQKAGIIKPHCAVVVTSLAQNPTALLELEIAAAVAGVTLRQAGPSPDPRFAYSLLAAENAGLAEATLKGLGLNTAALDLNAPCRWPGRFEEIAVNGQVMVLRERMQ
jgi:dihydrofolate synthase/folylpolyglutamate synthase